MLWKLVYASAIALLITGTADAQSNTGVQSNSNGQSSLGIPFIGCLTTDPRTD
jgi:hypothetical protein